MINFEEVFQQLNVGIIIISFENSDFYASQAALDLIKLKDPSQSALKEKLENISKISFEDAKTVLMHDNRDFLTFLSAPLTEEEKEENQLSPLALYYFPGRKKSDDKDFLSMVVFVMRADQHAHDRLMKQKLMAMAVHDIKTPLSSVKESSSLLWDGTVGELNDMQKKCMDIARKELSRLHRILENIIRIGQFDEHSFSEDFQSVGLKKIFSHLRELINEKCIRKKITINQQVKCEDQINILASENQLVDCLYYILDYIMEKADPSSELNLIGAREDGYSKFVFSYSGVIPPVETRQTIFSNFWEQKKTALIRKEHIDAFSLRICRSLINNIGGRIEIAEKDTGINEFTIFLPVK